MTQTQMIGNIITGQVGNNMKTKVGTIKVKTCKITKRKVKMYYTGDKHSEDGSNGHLGWLCLHK